MFLLLNQTKILWSALFLLCVLGVRRSRPQWLALLLLFISACLLTLDKVGETSVVQDWSQLPLWGVAAALLAALMSGFNAMGSEYIMRMMPQRRNAMLFTTELAVCKIVLLGVLSYYQHTQRDSEDDRGFFHGVNPKSFVLWGASALGGICVSAVSAHAGGDWKAYSLIAGLFLSGAYNYYGKDSPLSLLKLLAVGLVALSVYTFNAYPLRLAAASKSKVL
jgi:uncharacterized membrane protein